MDSMLLALDRITVWSYLQLHLHFDTRFCTDVRFAYIR